MDFLVPRKRGFVVAPAGSGKTVIGATALSRVLRSGMRVVWIANTTEQCQQAGEAIGRTEGPTDVDISICCAASCPDTTAADVIVLDEAHHAPATGMWLPTVANARSEQIVWGLSATPWHSEEERNVVLREVFREFFVIERERVLASGHLVEGQVYMHDLDVPGMFDEAINRRTEEMTRERVRKFPVPQNEPQYFVLSRKIKEAAKAIVDAKGKDFLRAASRGQIDETKESPETVALLEAARDASRRRDTFVWDYHERHVKWQITQETVQTNILRNIKVVELAKATADSTLILIHSIDHGEALVGQIEGSAVAHSKLSKKKRAKLIDDFRSGAVRVVCATALADEGMDIPRAATLILAAGGRSAGKLEQRAGRVLRPFEGKSVGTIHDFMDRGSLFAHAQARARMKVYERLGYNPVVVRADDRLAA